MQSRTSALATLRLWKAIKLRPPGPILQRSHHLPAVLHWGSQETWALGRHSGIPSHSNTWQKHVLTITFAFLRPPFYSSFKSQGSCQVESAIGIITAALGPIDVPYVCKILAVYKSMGLNQNPVGGFLISSVSWHLIFIEIVILDFHWCHKGGVWNGLVNTCGYYLRSLIERSLKSEGSGEEDVFLLGRLKFAKYSEIHVYLTTTRQHRNKWPSVLPLVSLLHLTRSLPSNQTAFSLFAFGRVMNKYCPSNS